jgi:hypothetical protein
MGMRNDRRALADVLEEKLPGYERPSFCTIIRDSRHSS